VLRAPNPMSVKGMAAWAGAGAAIGGTIGGAVGGTIANRGNMASGMGRRLGERVADGAINKFKGGADGAPGGDLRMTPKTSQQHLSEGIGSMGATVDTPETGETDTMVTSEAQGHTPEGLDIEVGENYATDQGGQSSEA